MTRIEAMAAVAQGVINISFDGACRVEAGSLIDRGIREVIRREPLETEKIKRVLHLLRLDGRMPSEAALVEARGIVLDLFNTRTDPEWLGDAIDDLPEVR